jgi:ATP/ADP translocase/HEAT repeat protein
MAKNRLHSFLSRIVEIKPGEGAIASFLFFYFFLITAPFTIIKSLRDGLFLSKGGLGSNKLPYAYATAILVAFVVAFHLKLQVQIRRRLLIIFSLLFFFLTGLIFWFILPKGGNWLLIPFWMWVNILVVVLVTQFWMLVNDVFNPREAKRLIGFFVSGGILGGMVGGFVTYLLAKPKVPNYDLLIVASVLLIACAVVVNYIFVWQRKKRMISEENQHYKKKGKEASKVGFKDCFDTVREDYYLKLLAAVVLLTGIVSTFVDWQFKHVIEAEPLVKDKLTGFFGLFNTGLLVFSFLLQLLMTSSLIKRYGIRFALLLYPAVLLILSLGIAAWPILGFALAIKASDKSLSFSINQSARELLYIPVPSQLKYKSKVFIDMFLNRSADSIGAVILLVVISLFHAKIPFVSVISGIFIFGWIVLNLKASKEYTNTVKQKLEMKWERADRAVAEKMDIDYTKLVFDTLESKNRSSILYAMHLFDLIKQDKLTPELRKLISYKSSEMKASSLGALFESQDTTLFPDTEDVIDDKTLEKDIKEIMSLDVYQELMKGYFDKTITDDSKEAVTVRMELAKAIGLMESHSPLVEKLEELLQDESPEVSKYAMESAANLRKKEYVPALVSKLRNPLTREDAISALKKYGQKIVGNLADYMGDTKENIELRKAVTSILGYIGTQDAADFLCWELAEDRGDMDSELIDALDKICSEKPLVQFPEDVLKSKIIKEIKKHYQILFQLDELSSESQDEPGRKALEGNLTISLMNIFKLLGIVYPREDIAKAYQNIRTGTKNSVAYAVELLDNILHKEMRDILLPVLEDISLAEKVQRCQSLLKSSPIFKESA